MPFAMKRNISPALLVGTALALVLLAVNLAFTFDNVGQLRRDAARVQHSNEVLLALQGVLGVAAQAEVDQRGYIITGKPEYLQSYRRAVQAIGRQLETLQALLRDDPERQAQLGELRLRLDARLGELDLAVAVRDRSGLAATQQIMMLGADKNPTASLQASGAALEASERKMRVNHENDAAKSYRNALVAGVVTGAAALLGVLAFAALMVRSLAARGRSEAALAAEAEKLRTTLASIGDAVITTDTAGRITSMNAAAESLTGWNDADAAGQELGSAFRVIDESTRQAVASPLAPVLRDGEPVSVGQHRLLLRKDGVERPIEDSVAPIRSAQDGVVGAVLVFRDISERKKTEKALRDAEARLRRVVMEMAVPTMAFADDGSVLFVNDAWVDGTGYGRDELSTIADWVAKAYPERAGFMRQHIDSLFALKARVDSGERQLTTASGVKRLWHFFTAPIGRDASGRRLLVTNAIDVTERKAIEGRLRESEARLRFALDAAGVGQWELGPSGASVQHSLRHDHIFGYDEPIADWSFERFIEHVVGDDRVRVEAAFREATAHVGVLDVECRIRRRDGAVRHLWIRASGQRDSDGATRLIGFVGDMTREKAAVEALREAGLDVPSRLPAAAAAEPPVAPVRHGLRILVVEDNDDAADAMVMLLGLAGHDAHVARTGGEALAMAAALQPQAVLLDIGLPDMSGYEVCRRLREDMSASHGGEPPLIVAVTGWAQQERDGRQSRAAGFDAHLVKPVGLQELGVVLARGR